MQQEDHFCWRCVHEDAALTKVIPYQYKVDFPRWGDSDYRSFCVCDVHGEVGYVTESSARHNRAELEARKQSLVEQLAETEELLNPVVAFLSSLKTPATGPMTLRPSRMYAHTKRGTAFHVEHNGWSVCGRYDTTTMIKAQTPPRHLTFCVRCLNALNQNA